ncbi:hypothetical protein, partial [Pseudomonas syringae]
AENSNFIKNLGCRSWVSYFENSTLAIPVRVLRAGVKNTAPDQVAERPARKIFNGVLSISNFSHPFGCEWKKDRSYK